jgi:CBS domain containing-hemolysin-like protein
METGLLAADKLRIYSKEKEGKKWARTADFLLSKPERLLGTVLIGNNIAIVTSAIILNSYLRDFYSEQIALLGSLTLTIVILIFAEIIPKSFFRQYANTITVRLAPILYIFFIIFYPITLILNAIVQVFLTLLGQGKHRSRLPESKADFRVLMHLSSKESGFEYDDYRVIDDILDFNETLAQEAMIPLHKYPIFHIKSKIPEVLRIAAEMNQRYFPCYSKRSDNIEGYIDVNDLSQKHAVTISSILREPLFFPETKPLPDLLHDMVSGGMEVVFLTDEYGAIAGIVTHQEIAAEIMGTIPGTIHAAKESVIAKGNNLYTVDGTADLEYFSHITGLTLEKENTETVGGYLCEKLGYIPAPGTTYEEHSVRFTIMDGDKRAISLIRVEIIDTPDD